MKMKVWITKYALSEGIFVIDGEVQEDFVSYRRPKHDRLGMQSFAHGKEWHKNEADALAHVEEMKKKKIQSLQKQIDKLEKMKIKF
ncbi:MAG: hypothetical protein LRY51_04085 [Geovibrio sp.]|nr:hypothetical protein [Geovibrio sp.]